MNKFLVYVINLEQDFYRLESTSQELMRNNLEFTRINAVAKESIVENSPYVTGGVMACWESHRKTLRAFLATEANFALVIEDDIKVVNDISFQESVETFTNSNFDVIQLGFLKPGLRNKIDITLYNMETRVFRYLAKFVGLNKRIKASLDGRMRIKIAKKTPKGWVADRFEAGTHCYIISRKAAESALNLNQPQFLSADDFFGAFAKMRHHKFIRPYRSIVDQKPFPSFEGPRFTNIIPHDSNEL